MQYVILIATLIGGNHPFANDPIVASIPYPSAMKCSDAMPHQRAALAVAYTRDEIMLQCIRSDIPRPAYRPIPRPERTK